MRNGKVPAPRLRPGVFSGRKSLLVRIVASQALLGVILVMLLSLYLFRQFSNNSIREITRASEVSLNQSVKVFETLWDSTYRYMNKEFLTNGMLMDAQNLEEFDPVFSGEVFRYLGNIVYNSGLFHSVYLYNGKADMVFSSLGPVRTTMDFYDSGLRSLLGTGNLKNTANLNHHVVYRRMVLSGGISPVNIPVMSVVYSDNDMQSAMIFNLDLQVLQNLVASQSDSATTRLLVLNADGTVIADSSGRDLFANFAGTALFQAIMSEESASDADPDGAKKLSALGRGGVTDTGGSLVREMEGRRVLLSWKTWNRQSGMDWRFVNLSDYRMLLSDVRAFQKQVFGVSGLFLVFSLLISLLFGRSIYRPISRLIERIRDGQLSFGTGTTEASELAETRKSEGNLSEIEYLTHTYDKLTQNVTRLLSFETAGRGAIRRETILRLLQGEAVPKADLARMMGDKPWLYASEGFRCAAIRFDGQTTGNRPSADDLALLRFAVLNIAGELFGSVMGVETLDVSEDLLCLVLHVGDPQETPAGQNERIHAVLEEISSACRIHLALSITSGVGDEVSLVTEISSSWKQAVEATDYRFTEGPGAILYHADVRRRSYLSYRYPSEAERDVTDALRASDASRLAQALERFVSEVSAFAIPEVRLACTQLGMVAGRIFENAIPAEERSVEWLLPAVGSVETLAELRTQWLNFYVKSMEMMRHKRDGRHDDQLTIIRERVLREYANANLTVEALAGGADLSANYLRTLYKEAFGFSISEHVAMLRFSEAKRLLRETDLPANRIAGQIGYQSAGYFYTAFRKATGMTPDEYRKTGPETPETAVVTRPGSGDSEGELS